MCSINICLIIVNYWMGRFIQWAANRLDLMTCSPLPFRRKWASVCCHLCLTLCNPVDCSPPGSSVRGILQTRMLEWVAISSSRILLNPGIKSASPAFAGGVFTTEPPGTSIWRKHLVVSCWSEWNTHDQRRDTGREKLTM